MKGTESNGPQGAFWMGSIQAAFARTALWGFYSNRLMFQGVTCGGAVAHNLPLSGK